MAYPFNKPHWNIVVFGHSNAGKSTIAGHLLIKCSGIPARVFERLEEEARRQNKSSSLYTFVMDKLKPDREHGRAVIDTIPPHKFCSSKNSFGIIDDSDCIKNMIAGTFQADVAMLVVSAAKDEFESGTTEQGQTFFEHALVAYALGVRQVVVLVNKMDSDTINYGQERYEEIRHDISAYLSNVGYLAEMITFVPVSGLTGANVTKKSDLLSWYNGPTLIEALDNLKELNLKDLPLRVSVEDVYRIGGIGTVAACRVETGVLTVRDKITVVPGNVTGDVKGIEQFHNTIVEAIPGDNIGVNLRGIVKKDMHRGCVIGHTYNEPPSEAIDFVAQIIILDHPDEIHEGYAPVVECHSSHVTCKFTELLAKYDTRTGEVVESAPNVNALQTGDWALVRLEPSKPMVVEPFTEFAPLGRIVVRDLQRTVAVGVIKSVSKKSIIR